MDVIPGIKEPGLEKTLGLSKLRYRSGMRRVLEPKLILRKLAYCRSVISCDELKEIRSLNGTFYSWTYSAFYLIHYFFKEGEVDGWDELKKKNPFC